MSVATMKKMSVAQILSNTKQMVRDYENKQYWIGESLAYISDNEIISKEQYRMYIMAELKLGYRKAMYLVQMYRHSVSLGYTEKQTIRLITGLGWTKAMMVLSQLTEKVVVSELLMQYQNQTAMEISAQAKTSKPSAEFEQFTFLLPKKHAKKLEKLLIAHGMEYNQNGGKRGISLAMQHYLESL